MNRINVYKIASLYFLLAVTLTGCASGNSVGATQAASAPISVIQPTTAAGNTVVPAGNAAGQNPEVSFSKDILPIFQTSCVSCHGGERTSKGLDLKTYDSLLKGSQNGSVLVPGDTANSKLMQSILSGKMPKRGNKLTQDQINLLLNWINSGAKNN
ncbi:MAG: c-type cytochrome domain-containing protein [Chloroflexota bacterium]